MPTLNLTPEVLRTLGEGVARLQDGDRDDNHAADKVLNNLGAMGYVYVGYNFVSKDWCVVVAHLAPTGADREVLTSTEKMMLRRMANGFGENVTDPDLLNDWSHVRDSDDKTIALLAAVIAQYRLMKGLPDAKVG